MAVPQTSASDLIMALDDFYPLKFELTVLPFRPFDPGLSRYLNKTGQPPPLLGGRIA
jgi:hypothetical protein